MTVESVVYVVVFLLWLSAVGRAGYVFVDGLKFNRFIRDALQARPQTSKAAAWRVAVIMPCKGVDEKLRETLVRLHGQTLPPARVIFVLESADDPAWAALKSWAATLPNLNGRFVEAGLAQHRGQKVHNLLAAVDAAGDDVDVYVFLDSDAVPGPDWLDALVAPLADDTVGVTTGYRWYTASGGVAAGARCAWNAATASLLADESLNFCWGGSMAIRRDRFHDLKVRAYWDGALSDDYQLTRAVRDAGLTIRFVPQALVASSDATSLGGFWEFARRQMIITRICHPALWRAGFGLIVHLTVGALAPFALAIAALTGIFGTAMAGWLGLAGWLSVTGLVACRAAARQIALRRLLGPPDLGWRDFAWDVGSTLSFGGGLHLHLFLASIGRRRFWWRDTEYEMTGPDTTRILRRR